MYKIKKLLKTFEVREDIFDKIYEDFTYDIKEVDDLSPYIYGYSPKFTIYYQKDKNGNEWMILREYILAYYTKEKSNYPEWYQIKIRKVKDLSTTTSTTSTITGTYATSYMNKLLNKYYTNEELEDIYNTHQCNFDDKLKQQHFNYVCEEQNVIYKIHNCVYVDINGAHCDALCELFPKASNDLKKMTELRKKYPNNEKYKNYKMIFNYFVGNMVNKGHRGTYNWIVQRTTKKLIDTFKYMNGTPIYVNTDGMILQNCTNMIDTSKALGEFDLEYQGIVYVYQSKNYQLYQFGNEMKGSCRCNLRDKVDLSKNQVVEYDLTRKFVGFNSDNQMHFNEVIDNIKIINGVRYEESY